ncbi:hypothetical protein K788_0006538 [Paraburkholderia caribensis MBA4]|uniref:Uncharacterized protein n=1 Tax=Paraburkholderia caribensis MBA4 TaxID=1323664 RepID=A0A0P0R8E8_9BURK|nr:hypothetical protein K788_0006538 [Paraburkholderia caribensis MBA4]
MVERIRRTGHACLLSTGVGAAALHAGLTQSSLLWKCRTAVRDSKLSTRAE